MRIRADGPPTEAALLARARVGDAQALSEIVLRHQDVGRRYVARLAPDPVTADDVNGDTGLNDRCSGTVSSRIPPAVVLGLALLVGLRRRRWEKRSDYSFRKSLR